MTFEVECGAQIYQLPLTLAQSEIVSKLFVYICYHTERIKLRQRSEGAFLSIIVEDSPYSDRIIRY